MAHTRQADLWEGTAEVEEVAFLRVLRETAEVLRSAGLPHVFMGGLASAALGRPRWTHDIDVFVRPEDARRTLAILEAAGFRTQETDPEWLFKALKDDVLVDVIFLSDGRVILDQEMARRARWADVEGIRLPVISAEDLIVIKALVHKERSPRHWFDALALLRREDLDWDYLLDRARRYNPLRVLSLLYYARSSDQVVPADAIRRLREDQAA
jgi:predicted nucleotidyltransferase